MDLFTFLLCKKKGGGGGGLTYTLSADTVNKQIVLTPSEGDAQAITVPYATDASTVNGKDVPELENGKIPATYLPSYVDDVLEYEDLAHFPAEGEVGKIYVALDTSLIYRWSGSVYAEISQSLALGETEATAYRGDRGKIAYDHSQSAHAPSNAEANQNAFSNITVGDTTIEADSKTDTFTLEAGDNITLTPDTSNDKITISATDVQPEPVYKTIRNASVSSFSDGADAPLDSLKASIEGVQDLHGYDKPWVGGAGVNKWDEQWEQGGINTADGTNQGASCIRSVNYIPVSSDSYYFYMGTDAQLYVYAYDENKTYIGTYYNGSYVKTGSVTNVRGTAITFPSNVKFIRFRTNTAYGTTYNNDIAINYPSTVTTYSPYSNICPISGWSSANVTRTGKNLFDKTATNTSNGYTENSFLTNEGAISINGSINISEYIKVSPSTDFVISGNVTSGMNSPSVCFYDISKNFISGVAYNNRATIAFTTPVNAAYLRMSYNKNAIDNYQLEIGETATTYEAYSGKTYTIPFKDSSDNPITVYNGGIDISGGSDNINKIKLTITSGIQLYGTFGTDNALLFYYDLSINIGTYSRTLHPNDNKLISNFYNAISTENENDMHDFEIRTNNNAQMVSNKIYIRDSRFESASAFNQYIANNPLEVVVKLAPQTTSSFIPIALRSDGVTNISVDCGEVTECKYMTQFYNGLATEKYVQIAIDDAITSALSSSY